MGPFSSDKQLSSIKSMLNEVAGPLDLNVSLKLWNGDVVPLGNNVDGKYTISLSGPGVIGSMLRWPTLETLMRLYATGHINFEGGDLIDFTEAMQATRSASSRAKLKSISKVMLAKSTFPF